MELSDADLLREAVRDHHPNEAFEKALGRAIRSRGETYQRYLDLIARVRRRAQKNKEGLVAAAKSLASDLE